MLLDQVGSTFLQQGYGYRKIINTIDWSGWGDKNYGTDSIQNKKRIFQSWLENRNHVEEQN